MIDTSFLQDRGRRGTAEPCCPPYRRSKTRFVCVDESRCLIMIPTSTWEIAQALALQFRARAGRRGFQALVFLRFALRASISSKITENDSGR